MFSAKDNSGGSIRKCPNCHNDVLPGWKICPYCEASLDENPAPVVRVPVYDQRPGDRVGIESHRHEIQENPVNLTEGGESIPNLKRGGCLNTYLIFLIVVTTLLLIGLLLALLILNSGEAIVNYILLYAAIAQIITLISLWGIYKWKKVGAIAFYVISIIFFIQSLFAGHILSSIWSMIALFLMISLLKPYWRQMN